MQGVRWAELEGAAVLAASDGSLAGLRDAAMLRLSSDALLRVGELAAVQCADGSPSHPERRAAAVGLEGRISGHSLRVGYAQDLASAGAELTELMNAGRWQSPAMPAHYARGQLAGRGTVARLRYGAA